MLVGDLNFGVPQPSGFSLKGAGLGLNGQLPRRETVELSECQDRVDTKFVTYHICIMNAKLQKIIVHAR